MHHMKTITHTATLAFSTEQMYNLVNDIESYPKFLKWCKSTKITDTTADEIQATMTVAVGAFEKTFETRNQLVANQSMKLLLVNGPFKHFEGLWSFEPLENNHCIVTYKMNYQFKNRLVGMVAEPIFASIADAMINTFKKRAEELYQ